jgi:hypothetical protein
MMKTNLRILWEAPQRNCSGLIGKTAMIRRTFGPRSNDQAMLTQVKLRQRSEFDPTTVAQG